MKIKRNCPNCDDILRYASEQSYLRACREKTLCKKCSTKKRFKDRLSRHPELWIVKCSKCGNERKFTHYVSFVKAKNNPLIRCHSCSANDNIEISEKNLHPQKGDKNGMYGKSVHSVWVEKYGKYEADKKEKNRQKKNRIASTGGKNPMYGKTVYDVWIEKYGNGVADKKMEALKKKQSKNNSGEKNNMYGKPSPQGSGNGWCGWYRGWFFRSLHELSYMISVIERFNLIWQSAESNKWKIKYIGWDGQRRNYFSDFIIAEKYMVECKPKKLWNSKTVILKKEAAEKFCKINGMKYKLVSPKILIFEKLMQLYKEGLVKFTKKYDTKFKKYHNRKSV